MASLSIGTRNLKFMQRAAAKTGTAVVDALPRAAIAAEEDAKWTLPRASSSGKPTAGTPGVRFESSYAPFLGFDEDVEEDKGEGSSRRAGGGRIAFGGFGEDEVKEESDEDEEGDEEEERREEDKNHRRREQDSGQARREKLGKMGASRGFEPSPANGKSKPPDNKKRPRPSSPAPSGPSKQPSSIPSTAHVTSKGFIRPSNFTDRSPSASESPNPPKKMSTAERLKQIAKARATNSQVPPAPDVNDTGPSASQPTDIAMTSSLKMESPGAAESSTSSTPQSHKARKRARKRAMKEAHADDTAENKRVKVDETPSSPAPVSPPATAISTATPAQPAAVDLDAREKELKAQRKREAKARRKEKQAKKGDERSR